MLGKKGRFILGNGTIKTKKLFVGSM
jgi:hypothetical protein